MLVAFNAHSPSNGYDHWVLLFISTGVNCSFGKRKHHNLNYESLYYDTSKENIVIKMVNFESFWNFICHFEVVVRFIWHDDFELTKCLGGLENFLNFYFFRLYLVPKVLRKKKVVRQMVFSYLVHYKKYKLKKIKYN